MLPTLAARHRREDRDLVTRLDARDPTRPPERAVADMGVGCVTCHVVVEGQVLAAPREEVDGNTEGEGESREYFDLFSPRGYAIGVNAVIYALTH